MGKKPSRGKSTAKRPAEKRPAAKRPVAKRPAWGRPSTDESANKFFVIAHDSNFPFNVIIFFFTLISI